MSIFFFCIAGGVVAFFVCFSFTRKAQISGVLLPSQGLIRVVPMQAGVVAERRVTEGQSVKANEVLFVLTSERASAGTGNAEQTISNLLRSRRDSLLGEQSYLRRQSTQRIDAASRRVDDLTSAIAQLEEQIALQRRRVAIADATVRRYVDLQASNFVSASFVQDKQGDLLDQQQRVADLERLRASATRDRSGAHEDLRDLQIQALRDQEGAQRSVAAIEQDLAENEARRHVFVRAPQDGVVTAITAEPGQNVTGNQSMAALIRAGSRLEAELYAPSRSAGFLKPGMDVLLRYHGFSYQKFGQAHGTVREISTSALGPEELSLPAARAAGTVAEPVYRVRIALDRQTVLAYGQPKALKSGEGLDASVLLETRRLYEWVLEPLYTVTGRI
ncbi:MAG: HlyD family efflux transporter periplasmic adaptor subunit [Caldimonas sp.]